MNIVTKSGTNALHGEALYLGRPGGTGRPRRSRPTASARRRRRPASRRARSTAINPADVPDELNQVSGSVGGPIVKDKTFFFATADYTRQDRTTFLSTTLPAFVLPADGSLDVRRPLPPGAGQRPRRSQAHAGADADGAGQLRPLLRHQSQRRGRRHERADRRAALHAPLLDDAGQSHVRARPEPPERGARRLPERRSGHAVGAAAALDDLHARRHRCRSRSANRARPTSTAISCRSPTRCPGRAAGTPCASAAASCITRPAAPAASRAQAVLGTFTFLNTTTAPFDQLTLADVQQYAQPISYGITQLRAEAVDVGGVRAGQHPREQRPDDRRRPALRPADADRRDDELRAAPRLRLASRTATRALAIRGGYGMYYTQIRANALAERADRRARRARHLHGHAGTVGLPDVPDGRRACRCNFDPRTLPASQQPARNITIRAGQRDVLRDAVRAPTG